MRALPAYAAIAERPDISRQLIRYYFEEPDALLCKLCDVLADQYRAALALGVETLTGPARLRFIFDFYFDLAGELRKPRDDQSYDAVFAYAAGSKNVQTNLRMR